MRISVGIPTYDGKLPMQSVACLLTEVSIASMMGDSIHLNFLPSCTNLAIGRNQLVKEFLASNHDRLVFLDADVTFEPGSLLTIAKHPHDVVGGAYRYKMQEEKYPVAFFDKDVWDTKNKLLRVSMLPTGFMSLSRNAFSKFREWYPNREYSFQGSGAIYAYFQIPFKDGSLYSEDAYFCREWREKDGEIWLDPNHRLTHWNGNIPFVGHIGEWFKSRQGSAQSGGAK